MTLLTWYRNEVTAMDAAQRDARALKAKYGAGVEGWVDSGLAHPDRKHRRWVRRIEAALKGLRD